MLLVVKLALIAVITIVAWFALEPVSHWVIALAFGARHRDLSAAPHERRRR